MSYRQFRGWLEYFKREPFGDDQITFLLAWLLSMFHDANRDSKKTPYRGPSWFLWQLREQEVYASDEAIKRAIQSAKGAV